jgi:hypothetical protein
MSPPPYREPPVTNLGKVFGQFAELPQQITGQVVALEDAVHPQKQDRPPPSPSYRICAQESTG